MHKSIRLFALAAAMTLAAAPSLKAEQMGTNPHPQVTKVMPNAWTSFVSNLRSYFGM